MSRLHKRKPEPEQPLKTFPVRYYRRDEHDQVTESGEMLWGLYSDGGIHAVAPFDIPAKHSIEWLIDPMVLIRMEMERGLANHPI